MKRPAPDLMDIGSRVRTDGRTSYHNFNGWTCLAGPAPIVAATIEPLNLFWARAVIYPRR